MAHALQVLYDACKATFTRNGASSQDLETVRSIIDVITPSDLGLNEEIFAQHDDRGFGFFGVSNSGRGQHSSMVARWALPISYLHIYECEHFSMGIFCLPTSAVIPLHNHPGMTVLSKLLYGSMHVKAYDWINPSVGRHEPGTSQAFLAQLVMDEVMSAPCKSSVLYPTRGGNIHALTGVTPCAVLDVLAPPYSAKENRNCIYYRDFPHTSGKEQGLTWLEECQLPDDFVLKPVPYKPPWFIL